MAEKKGIAESIRNHLNVSSFDLPVIRQLFDGYERPNLHLAIDELSSEKTHLIGIVERDYSPKLSRLSSEASDEDFDEGPVEYVEVEVANDLSISSVKQAIYLTQDQGEPIVILLGMESETYPPKILLEVMSAEKDRSQRYLRQIIRMTRECKAYRGKSLSLGHDCYGSTVVKFHRLPQIERDQIILPQELLSRIERHTITFSTHVEKLRLAKRHIKRGILLHGPPGTGKTLSAMYLASRMEGRTVINMTGGGMGSIESACNLARMLEPTTVILEDVDLIGTQRNQQSIDANALLFELLNQMDGLSQDCDILFILTTNRPDILEPALSSRPGRIDQALEVPLPNEDCRKRLIELYSDGLQLELSNLDDLIARTQGVSAAFIRELLRKAAVIAADESPEDQIVVRDTHVHEALSELVIAGGDLTKTPLGATEIGSE